MRKLVLFLRHVKIISYIAFEKTQTVKDRTLNRYIKRQYILLSIMELITKAIEGYFKHFSCFYHLNLFGVFVSLFIFKNYNFSHWPISNESLSNEWELFFIESNYLPLCFTVSQIITRHSQRLVMLTIQFLRKFVMKLETVPSETLPPSFARFTDYFLNGPDCMKNVFSTFKKLPLLLTTFLYFNKIFHHAQNIK